MTVKYSIRKEDLNINPYDVLRYLGYAKDKITQEDEMMVAECIEEARDFLSPKACYDRYHVELMEDNRILMPYGEIVSKSLSYNLAGCKDIYMFAATIGASYDRAIKTMSARSMAKGSVFNAIGAAAVEEVCDRINEELRLKSEAAGEKLKTRFSPGYGDLSLDNQTGVFRVLDPAKHAGITLKDTLIMAPEKSVSAIIGIYDV